LAKVTTLLRRHRVLRVGIERGDGPVVEHLLRAGFEVVVISARQVKSLRARYGSAGNKDDRFDAFVLADALRTDAGRWAVVQPDSAETLALRMLVRARHDLVDHRIAVHNQLLAVLQHNFPGAIGLFHQLDIPISLAFMRRFPSEAKATWLSEVRLAHWLKANGYFGRKPAAELIAHLREAAVGRVAGAAAEASELIVLALVDLLTGLRKQQADLETRIKEALLAHPDGPIFQSLPRSGVVRAATRLAEIGDCRARFPDPQALAAAAGVAPSTRQSGKHLNVAYRRGCNKQLRAALIDWAQDTPRANAWAHDTYYRARERGCRHPHAARILAQAWTRILWRCWQQHMPYQPALHGRLASLEQKAA
jgi:transposase